MVVRPKNLARFEPFETKHFAEIKTIGYEAAQERMDEIRGVVGE